MRRLALVAVLASLAPLGACGKAAPTGSAARDALVAAWKQGGLDATAFKPTQTQVGKDCATSTVSKIDVLVCAFSSEDDAKAAHDNGLLWVGDTTGAARAKGTLLIAVADRHNADPSGKTINQIFKLAP